jgi:hypothetical protein
MGNKPASPPLTSNEAEAFVNLIRPRPRPGEREITENDDYMRWMHRLARIATYRAIEDPEMITQLIELRDQIADAANIAVAVNRTRYHADPRSGASMIECATAMKITKQSASDRASLGADVVRERLAAAELAAGAVQLDQRRAARLAADQLAAELERKQEAARRQTEVEREKKIISTAQETGEAAMGTYRARHLRVA